MPDRARSPEPGSQQGKKLSQSPNIEKRAADTTDSRQSPLGTMVVSLPSLLALTLGLAYVVGALTFLGQLTAEGFDAVSVFAQMPLEQHLGRGLVALLSPGFLLTAFYAFLWIAPSPLMSVPRSAEHYQMHATTRTWVLRAVIPLLALLALIGPWPMPARLAVAVAITALVYMMMFWEPRVLPNTYRAKTITLLVTGWIAYALASFYIMPKPLPDAVVRGEDGAVRGKLLLQAGETWYLGQPTDEVIVLTPSTGDAARVIPADDDQDEPSVLDLVF